MKYIWIFLAVVGLGVGANAQIVNNSGSTAADSIAIPFVMLDSAGNTVVMASNDSAFIHIYYPSGAIAFQDTVAFGNSLITSTTVATNVSTNTYKAAVADIDGSGKDGVYTYEILVTDASKARLVTPNTGFFQLYQNDDFNKSLDSIRVILDSLQLLDEKYTSLRDSINLVHAEVNNINAWTPLTDNDSLKIDMSTARTALLTFLAGGADSVQVDLSTFNAGSAFVDSVTSLRQAGAIDDIWEYASASVTSTSGMGYKLRDSLGDIYAEVLNIDAWNPITDNDSLIVDQSTMLALRPTIAGRTLDVSASGNAGIDWGNIENRIVGQGYVREALDTNLQIIKTALGITGREEDSTCLVRFVSLSGDNTDGKSWATAWNSTTWVDSANLFWKNLQASSNYDGMNILYFSADSFMTAGKLCSLKAPNTWMIGAGDWGVGAPATKIYRRQSLATDTATAGDSDLVRILADNCHIINFTLNAADTAGDPDFGAGTGGNNAITFDSAWQMSRGVRGGEVAYCYFPYLNHKPIQANARGDARYVAYNIWIHDNQVFRPKKHGIDGFFRSSVIEDNIFTGPEFPGDHASGSATIQLIGTNSDSLVGKSNVVRRNTITQMDVGIALINTDSNIIADNIISYPSSAAWTVSNNYRNNTFTGNIVNYDVPQADYGLLTNGSFEARPKDKYTPLDWSDGNGATIGNNGRSEVNYDVPRTGGWSYLLAGDTVTATNQPAYINSKLVTLTKGRYTVDGWYRVDGFNSVAYDTLATILYKDKTSGDSVVTTWKDWPQVATDTIYGTWIKFGHDFTINSSANYYLSFLAYSSGSAQERNIVFIDDIALNKHIGDTLLANIAASLDPNDSVFVKGGFVDSNKAEQGGIAGATIPLYVYAIDTSGTDDTVSMVSLGLFDAGGTFKLPGITKSEGYFQFTVTSGTWTVVAGYIGYVFDDSNYVVTANDTVAIYGYNVPTTSAPASHTCATTVNILKNDGTPAKGVQVTAYLTRSNAVDSNGTPLFNQIQNKTTDVNGQVTFDCVWSSFIVPSTDWMFSCPTVGNLNKKVTIPRQTTYTVDFSH